MARLIAAYHTDEDDIALLPLESIDRIDGDQMAERLPVGVALDELAQQSDLSLVGTDEPYIETLVENAVATYLVEIVLQRPDDAVFLFSEIASAGFWRLVLSSAWFSRYSASSGVSIHSMAVSQSRMLRYFTLGSLVSWPP